MCISRFSNRKAAAKDPPSAAADLFRASLVLCCTETDPALFRKTRNITVGNILRYPTAITQNVEYLLDSVQASTMLSNSEFVVMLNQAASDRMRLAELLNISKEQLSYITNADAGCGLIRYGSALVPFINRFPKDTKMYQLMTTRPGEGSFAGGHAS